MTRPPYEGLVVKVEVKVGGFVTSFKIRDKDLHVVMDAINNLATLDPDFGRAI